MRLLADTAHYVKEPQNRCIEQRQQFLNPDNKGFARTFTGSFLVGKLYGPFDGPKQTPMNHALGILPEHSQTIINDGEYGKASSVQSITARGRAMPGRLSGEPGEPSSHGKRTSPMLISMRRSSPGSSPRAASYDLTFAEERQGLADRQLAPGELDRQPVSAGMS